MGDISGAECFAFILNIFTNPKTDFGKCELNILEIFIQLKVYSQKNVKNDPFKLGTLCLVYHCLGFLPSSTSQTMSFQPDKEFHIPPLDTSNKDTRFPKVSPKSVKYSLGGGCSNYPDMMEPSQIHTSPDFNQNNSSQNKLSRQNILIYNR